MRVNNQTVKTDVACVLATNQGRFKHIKDVLFPEAGQDYKKISNLRVQEFEAAEEKARQR